MASTKHKPHRITAHDRKPRFPLAAFYIRTVTLGGKGEICVELNDVIYRDRDIGKWFIEDARALLDHIEADYEKNYVGAPEAVRKAEAKVRAEREAEAKAKPAKGKEAKKPTAAKLSAPAKKPVAAKGKARK